MEPYEVAPGIWSTDATARVFGYLSTNDKKTDSRVQSAEANIQAPSKKAKRKPVPIGGPLSEYEQARFAKRIEERPTDTIKDEAEILTRCNIERCDEERIKSGNNWPRARRKRMRTVSRDDQLVERGANPRTGLVSPFIVSDDSEERRRNDYITAGEGGLADPSPRRRTRSGKWKQDSLGWSLVESPLLSPIAQSMSDKMSRTVSIKQLENRLLVETPVVDDPEPDNMTDEQIKKYQESIALAYRRGGGSLAMLDPDTLLSPRKTTAERTSTSPTKLHKIQRKEVGSGVVRQSNSGDTVIVNANNSAPPLSTPRKNIMKRQEARVFTPSNTPKGSSFESGADISNTVRKTDPFLGPGSRKTCSLMASATQSQSYLNTGPRPAHQCLQNDLKSSPSPAPSDPPPAFPTLDRYLPRLQFPHPSHFANLQTSSYRRPTQLLRARLSPLGQQRQVVEDACTTTFTTTSKKGPKREQRPTIQRQEGNKVVPRVNQFSPGPKMPPDQTITPRNKPFHPSAATVDTLHLLDLVTGKSRATAPTEKANPAKDLANTRHQTKTWIPADCLRQAPCGNRPRNVASPTQSTQGLCLGSANVTRERIQANQSGAGCIPTYGLPGKEHKAVPGVGLQHPAGDKEQAILPAELTVGGESRAWFAGQWADVQEEGQRLDLNTLIRKETLGRRTSVLRREANVKLWMHIAEAWAEHFPKLGFILGRMIGHVMRTLHHASSAFIILRTAKTTTRDHFRAMRDLVLATLYLLLLLNLCMALKKVLFFVGKLLYWIGHPVQTIVMIVGWCVIG